MNQLLPVGLLTECDMEPIHSPGAVQPHGALLAVDADSWRITHASGNLAAFINVDAAVALGQPLAALLGAEVTEALRNAISTRGAASIDAGLDAALAPGAENLRLLPFVSTNGTIGIDLIHEASSITAEAALIRTQHMVQALRLARTAVGLCRIAANKVRGITGYDRFMVYRFDEDGSGEVIAESCNAGVESFLGLKYPASDVPRQARRLYMVQRVRIIADVNGQPAVLLSAPDAVRDLDLSASTVRAVSPFHLQYLRNMGVTATAAVSLIVEGRLWGMLVCHHNTPMALNGEIREFLALVGQCISVMLDSLIESEAATFRLERQRVLSGIQAAVAQPDAVLLEVLTRAAGDLLQLIDADGALVTIGNQTIAVGRTPTPETISAVMAVLTEARPDDLMATARLPEQMGVAAGTLDGFAGALLLPLPSCDNGSVIWFRKELSHTKNWAGNPAKSAADPVTGRLEPRASFAVWQEETSDRSAAWIEADLDAARDLRRVIDAVLVRRGEAELIVRMRDHDRLTGLPNRQAMQNQLEAMAKLREQPPTGMVVINVDRFRKVNEALDNQAGDTLLLQSSHRLQVILGRGDMAARIGTDEFAVLTTGTTARELAVRIHARFAQPFEIAKQMLQISVSVGFADNTVLGPELSWLMRAAETAMRQSKMRGGNRISVYVQTLLEESTRQLAIEQYLEASLRSGRHQFHLELQPIVDARAGTLRGWEVLLRWTHPILGPMLPGMFIPIAESAGLIGAVGDLVLQKAMRLLVDMPSGQGMSERDLYLSVNVSPLQLLRVGFAEQIASMLDQSGVVPSRLCIEITEGVFTDTEAVTAIHAIRNLGVRVAVDDFGIGQSSLSTLRRLPADIVKLDRSFLSEQDMISSEDRAFLSAVVALAHTTGLTIVMEGVETRTQLDAVVEAGVDAIQGYFFARPMRSEAAVALMCQSPQERGWTPQQAKLPAV